MALLQMSISGGMFILAVLAVRAAALHRLPKQTFSLLWKIALLRLLVPITVTSVLCIYPLLQRSGLVPAMISDSTPDSAFPGILFTGPDMTEDAAGVLTDTSAKDTRAKGYPDRRQMTEGQSSAAGQKSTAGQTGTFGQANTKGHQDSFPETGGIDGSAKIPAFLPVIWGLGAAVMALGFFLAYQRSLREFRTSLPVSDELILRWLKEHPLKRKLSVRYSDRIVSPLTYGVLRPVILLPKKAGWDSEEQLSYILLHEYVHVRRFDAAFKLLFALALCVHWFNPAVWLMYLLFGRDAELACDEQVVRISGDASSYARTLISMEALKSGLSPFCGFNENPLKERITGIMKTKKATLAASLTAATVILIVTAVFATSGRRASTPENDGLSGESSFSETVSHAVDDEPSSEPSGKQAGVSTPVQTSSILSEEDARMLRTLEFDGYMQMSVAEFRERFLTQTDTPEYQELLKRLSKNSDFRLQSYSEEDPDAVFYVNVVENLTGDDWDFRSYERTIASSFFEEEETTMFQYTFTLAITDPELLTVEAYGQARIDYHTVMDGFFSSVRSDSAPPYPDAETIQKHLDLLKEELESRQTKGLTMSAEYSLSSEQGFFTGMAVSEDAQLTEEWKKQIRAQYEQELAVFRPYGLSWQCLNDGELKMFFEGKEVRGIFDPEQGTWISAHTGNSAYSDDAIDLYTVYENGNFQGLRPATKEESALWDEIRASQRPMKGSEEAGESGESLGETDPFGQNSRLSSPGTKSDYESLLALKTPGYEKLPLYLFNSTLLEWANENFGRMERISEDISRNEYPVTLTEEEQAFLEQTVFFSGKENAADIQSNYTKLYDRAPIFQETLPAKNLGSEDQGMAVCELYYEFSWRIPDRRACTVGERNRIIGNRIREVRDALEETDTEELLQMTEKELCARLATIADQGSSELLTITLGDTAFEKMDERE